MDGKDVCERLGQLERRRLYWEGHWQDVLDYVLPQRPPVGRNGMAGEKRVVRQYDSTATRMMRRLAATLTGMMCSPSDLWFRLRPVDARGRAIDDPQSNAWLEASAEQLYDALHASNFYSEIPEAFADLITIGTCDLYAEERPIMRAGFNGFRFCTVTPGEYYIDEGADGSVDTVYRLVKLTARQAKLKFGDGKGGTGKLPPSVVAALKNDPMAEFEFVHAVQKNDDRKRGARSQPGMEWTSTYIEKATETVVEEGAFRDQRHFVARWSKASGEVYGRGPAMEALPDIKALNTIMRYSLEGLALEVYPPWLFPDESVIGRLKLTPGAPNVYDGSIEGEIKPLRGGGNFNVELAKEQELRSMIAQTFLDDIMAAPETPKMTATEVLDRRERRQQITGPAVARVQTELLDPLVTTCWKLMFRAGAFGKPPEALGRAREIEVDYISPLAKMQKLGTVRALQDAFALLGPLASLRPDMADHWNFDRIARDIPGDIGVPRDWLNPEDQVAKMRQARAQMQQMREAAATVPALQQAGATIDETKANTAKLAAEAQAAKAA